MCCLYTLYICIYMHTNNPRGVKPITKGLTINYSFEDKPDLWTHLTLLKSFIQMAICGPSGGNLTYFTTIIGPYQQWKCFHIL